MPPSGITGRHSMRDRPIPERRLKVSSRLGRYWGMHKGERLRFVAIVGVVIAVLSAGFALAGDAFDDPADEPTSTCEPTDGVGDDGDTVEDPEGSEGEEPVDEGEEPVDEGEDEGDTEDCDDPAEGDEAVEDDEAEAGSEEGVDASQKQDYTAEDCLAATGDADGEEPSEKPVPGEL